MSFALLTGHWTGLGDEEGILFHHPHQHDQSIFPHKTKNCAILAIKQLPYNPKSKHSKMTGCFEEVFFLKQLDKNMPVRLWQIFNLQAFDPRAWKPVWNCLDTTLRTFHELKQLMPKMLCGTHSFVRGTRRFLAAQVPGLTTNLTA